jgi:hypothetical protein
MLVRQLTIFKITMVTNSTIHLGKGVASGRELSVCAFVLTCRDWRTLACIVTCHCEDAPEGGAKKYRSRGEAKSLPALRHRIPTVLAEPKI